MAQGKPVHCPQRDSLMGLLSGAVGADSGLAQHVDGCLRCQGELDQLSDEGYLAEFRAPVQLAKDTSRYLEPSDDPAYLGLIDGIAILRQIGAGGMGIVFHGDDLSLGRSVAVKVLKRGSSHESGQRFLRETKAAAGLKHANLVPVYSAGQAIDGRPYLVMPLIEGNSLKQRLEIGLPSPSETAMIIMQVCRGLQEAHDNGIVHRDIKPANILLDSQDKQAKLTDFGLVRSSTDETLTAQDVVCGTPEYMSPEAMSPEKHQTHGDIYSLGVVLYECLTGSIPFRGQALDVLEQHRSADPQQPRDLNRTIPLDMETICLKALSKEPSQRYQSPKEFEEDLQRYLLGKPVFARREGWSGRCRRWVLRNRLLASSLCAATALLIAGTTISTWFWIQSEKNAALAEKRALTLRQSNAVLQQNQADFIAALSNSTHAELVDFSFAAEMPSSVRNSMMIDMVSTMRLLVDRIQDDDREELRKMAQQCAGTFDVAYQMAMDNRLVEISAVSIDVGEKLLACPGLTTKDHLLVAKLFDQRAAAMTFQGKPDEALAYALRARELLLAIDTEENSLDDEVQARLAKTDCFLATLHQDKSQKVAELEKIAASLPPADSLDGTDTSDRIWLSLYERVYLNLAQNTDGPASSKFRAARAEILKRLRGSAPTRVERVQLIRKIAVNDAKLGMVALRSGDAGKAIELLVSSGEQLQRLVSSFPLNLQYRADVFETHVLLANIFWRREQQDEALAQLESAIQLRRISIQMNPGDHAVLGRMIAVLQQASQYYLQLEQPVLSAEAMYEAATYCEQNKYEKVGWGMDFERTIGLYEKAVSAFEEAGVPERAEEAKARLQKVIDLADEHRQSQGLNSESPAF